MTLCRDLRSPARAIAKPIALPESRSARPVCRPVNRTETTRVEQTDFMPSTRLLFVLASVTLLTTSVAAPAASAKKVDYNRDIRPILSDKCFFCHGPDEQKREAGLRLDTREGALKKHAIVPGKPDKSELFKRVTTKDAGDHMPPAKAKLASLTTVEVDLLRRWIAEGAQYEAHWAFVPLQPVASPGSPAGGKSLVISAKSKDPRAPSTLITNHFSLISSPNNCCSFFSERVSITRTAASVLPSFSAISLEGRSN